MRSGNCATATKLPPFAGRLHRSSEDGREEDKETRWDGAHQMGALRDLQPGEAQEGHQGPWVHALESSDRAPGYPFYPGDGQQSTASGAGDRRAGFGIEVSIYNDWRFSDW